MRVTSSIRLSSHHYTGPQDRHGFTDMLMRSEGLEIPVTNGVAGETVTFYARSMAITNMIDAGWLVFRGSAYNAADTQIGADNEYVMLIVASDANLTFVTLLPQGDDVVRLDGTLTDEVCEQIYRTML